LGQGKAKKAALGATMRKLVHLCFGVLKTRQPCQTNYAVRLDKKNGIYGTPGLMSEARVLN
jgi:hypothetical protein